MRTFRAVATSLVAVASVSAAVGGDAARVFAIDWHSAAVQHSEGLAGAHGIISSRAEIDPALFVRRSAIGPNNIYTQPKTHEGTVAVAQLKPLVKSHEASSGNPSLPPAKWVGLLVLPDPKPPEEGRIVRCTGQFIAQNVVLTAGHCLKDLQVSPDGPWPDVTKGTFWLQYQDNEGIPFKILCGAANPLWTLPVNYDDLSAAKKQAALNEAWQHDFAMILVDGKSPTGVMHYMLDWKNKTSNWRGKLTDVVRIGYPDAILGAAVVQQVPGIVFFADQIPMGPDMLPNEVVHWGSLTNFTQGSSGGAWIMNFSTTDLPNSNLLLAVSSFITPSFPGAMFGAYLKAAEFNPLLTSAARGCR